METKINKIPVYKTTSVQVDTKDEIKYVSKDGTEFYTKHECVRHEEKLAAIEKGEDQFSEIVGDLFDFMSVVVGADDCSYLKVFKWVGTKDEKKMELAHDYLWGIGAVGNYQTKIGELQFNEGESILIATYTCADSSDYPYAVAHAITYDNALERINTICNNCKNILINSI